MVRIFLIAALILSLSSINAIAIPSEGNFLPDSHKTIWGFQFNNIFLRDFNKVEGKGITKQYFFKASYALTERFFLDGKIGLGSICYDGPRRYREDRAGGDQQHCSQQQNYLHRPGTRP